MDALQVVKTVIDGRKRFGSLYGTGEFTSTDILNALVELHDAGELDLEESHGETVKVKRQLTASQAREAKLKKQIEKLKREVSSLEETIEVARGRW